MTVAEKATELTSGLPELRVSYRFTTSHPRGRRHSLFLPALRHRWCLEHLAHRCLANEWITKAGVLFSGRWEEAETESEAE